MKGISGWLKTAVRPKLAAKPCGTSGTLACFCLLFVSVYLGQKLSFLGLAFTEAPSRIFQRLCDIGYIMMHSSLSGPLLKRQVLSILGCPVL